MEETESDHISKQSNSTKDKSKHQENLTEYLHLRIYQYLCDKSY